MFEIEIKFIYHKNLEVHGWIDGFCVYSTHSYTREYQEDAVLYYENESDFWNKINELENIL